MVFVMVMGCVLFTLQTEILNNIQRVRNGKINSNLLDL